MDDENVVLKTDYEEYVEDSREIRFQEQVLFALKNIDQRLSYVEERIELLELKEPRKSSSLSSNGRDEINVDSKVYSKNIPPIHTSLSSSN